MKRYKPYKFDEAKEYNIKDIDKLKLKYKNAPIIGELQDGWTFNDIKKGNTRAFLLGSDWDMPENKRNPSHFLNHFQPYQFLWHTIGLKNFLKIKILSCFL